MIVLDASAYVDVLLRQATDAVFEAMASSGHWVVPEHFRVEAASGVRGAWLGKQIDDEQFDRLTDRIAAQDLDVWPTAPLLPRIRQLAANATAYDAAYLALAEEIGSPLVTADAKFSRVPGIQCRVIGA